MKKEYTSTIKKKQVTFDGETKILQSNNSMRSFGYMAHTKDLSHQTTEKRIARLESNLSTLMVVTNNLLRRK